MDNAIIKPVQALLRDILPASVCTEAGSVLFYFLFIIANGESMLITIILSHLFCK